MNEELKQIEADVVIILHNPTERRGRVCPLWECEEAPEALNNLAAKWALEFNEQCGSGHTDFIIHDFRAQEVAAAA